MKGKPEKDYDQFALDAYKLIEELNIAVITRVRPFEKEREEGYQ